MRQARTRGLAGTTTVATSRPSRVRYSSTTQRARYAQCGAARLSVQIMANPDPNGGLWIVDRKSSPVHVKIPADRLAVQYACPALHPALTRTGLASACKLSQAACWLPRRTQCAPLSRPTVRELGAPPSRSSLTRTRTFRSRRPTVFRGMCTSSVPTAPLTALGRLCLTRRPTRACRPSTSGGRATGRRLATS